MAFPDAASGFIARPTHRAIAFSYFAGDGIANGTLADDIEEIFTENAIILSDKSSFLIIASPSSERRQNRKWLLA